MSGKQTVDTYGRAPICPLRKRDHCIAVCIGVCIGYESGMHRCTDRGTHQVITLSVELGEGGFGARAHVFSWRNNIEPPPYMTGSLKPMQAIASLADAGNKEHRLHTYTTFAVPGRICCFAASLTRIQCLHIQHDHPAVHLQKGTSPLRCFCLCFSTASPHTKNR